MVWGADVQTGNCLVPSGIWTKQVTHNMDALSSEHILACSPCDQSWQNCHVAIAMTGSSEGQWHGVIDLLARKAAQNP